ncbi:MAG: hypothetical protein KF774_09400 [Planctomyces sp.]|nr:hypothetical protein [Planctomyces sp.]
MNGHRPVGRVLLAAALLAVLARGVACWRFSGNLNDDRDAYLGIAQGVREGRGFSIPGTDVPTAYRPPLYPLLLAPISGPDAIVARAALHAILGGLTAAATVWLAAIAGCSTARQLAAGVIVAVDPLLVYYSTLPMTETLAAALSAGLLACAAAACRSSNPRAQVGLGCAAGGLFGLCVLCRPTYWAFALWANAFGLWQWVRDRRQRGSESPASSEPAHRNRGVDWLLAGLMFAVIVVPWPLRNWRVFGRPIVTTTHGGYTLLLGNNPAYYREVVAQPLGTIWDGSHGPGLEAWQADIERDMTAAGVKGDIARDRWMRQQALRTIRKQPERFAQACMRRCLAFWSISPGGGSAIDAGALRHVISVFYVGLWGAVILGLAAALRRGGCAVEVSLLLTAAFVSVHLFYWTDARMRAPVMPAAALLASLAGSGVRRGPGGAMAT